MIVKVQTCWNGRGIVFRALIGGGIIVSNDDKDDNRWHRSTATRMLDRIEVETGLDRRKIRFRHV